MPSKQLAKEVRYGGYHSRSVSETCIELSGHQTICSKRFTRIFTLCSNSAGFELIVFEPVPFEGLGQVLELFRGGRFDHV